MSKTNDISVHVEEDLFRCVVTLSIAFSKLHDLEENSGIIAVIAGACNLYKNHFFMNGSQNGSVRRLVYENVITNPIPFIEDPFLFQCKQIDHLH
jgi:hypothetical protein